MQDVAPCAFADLGRLSEGAALVIAAHPDDEVIGAGALLSHLPRAGVVTITDGAPKTGSGARIAGFRNSSEYAKARRREAREALALLDRDLAPCINLKLSDQQSIYGLQRLVSKLLRFLTRARYDYVITHPYEGGHPDHDAAAFAVQAACTLLWRWGLNAPTRVEMTSYHAKDDQLAYGDFLPHPDAGPTVSFLLDKEEKHLKQKMFRCHQTQARVLSAFPLDAERFRLAPDYDFRLPPHDGALVYERYNWKIDGTNWRREATRALADLNLLDG